MNEEVILFEQNSKEDQNEPSIKLEPKQEAEPINQTPGLDESRKKVWKETAKELTFFGKTYPLILPKWSDARLIQIGILSTVNLLGQLFFHFSITPLQIFLVVGTSVSLDVVLTFLFRKIILFPASGFISGLSLAFLLQIEAIDAPFIMYILAGVLAIASKQFITYKNKHIFNPSNFALVYILLLFPSAYITPDNWNASLFVLIPVIAIGMRLIIKAKVAAVSFMFIASEILLYLLFHHSLSAQTFLNLKTLLFSPSILIFTLFMMTDPRTVPKTQEGKILYSFLTALLHQVFSVFNMGSYGLFFSLFLVCMAVPGIDALIAKYSAITELSEAINNKIQETLKPIQSRISDISLKVFGALPMRRT